MWTGLWLAACAPRWPTAELQDVEMVAVGFESAEARLHLAVDNPLLLEVPVSALRWELQLAEQPFASGTLLQAPPLAANAVTVLPVPISVRYTDLLSAASVGSEAVPYRVKSEVDLDTPLGIYTVPMEHAGTLPALTPPSIDIVDLGVGIDGWSVRLDIALLVSLPAGLRLTELTWTMTLAGRPVANGQATVGADGTVRLPIWLQPTDAAMASWEGWFDPTATARLDLTGTLETPLGPVPVEVVRELALHAPTQ